MRGLFEFVGEYYRDMWQEMRGTDPLLRGLACFLLLLSPLAMLLLIPAYLLGLLLGPIRRDK